MLCAGEAWPDPLLDLVPPGPPGGHLSLREFVFVHDLTPFQVTLATSRRYLQL
jgi:hypothetical protein